MLRLLKIYNVHTRVYVCSQMSLYFEIKTVLTQKSQKTEEKYPQYQKSALNLKKLFKFLIIFSRLCIGILGNRFSFCCIVSYSIVGTKLIKFFFSKFTFPLICVKKKILFLMRYWYFFNNHIIPFIVMSTKHQFRLHRHFVDVLLTSALYRNSVIQLKILEKIQFLYYNMRILCMYDCTTVVSEFRLKTVNGPFNSSISLQ